MADHLNIPDYSIPPSAPLSPLNFVNIDLNLRLGSSSESLPSSETTTLSGRDDSIDSSDHSLCSSRTSSSSGQSTKQGKRVRFEESVSWSFFDEQEGMARPQLRKQSSFLSRSWDRVATRNHPVSEPEISNIGVPPAALSALTEHLNHLKRRNAGVDLATLALKTTSRYATPGRKESLVLTIEQPLHEGTGRRYKAANTSLRDQTPVAATPSAPKGDWGDLLGSSKSNPVAV
jgi:hypothetical protein